MLVIRRRDNPKILLAASDTRPGGLGVYDYAVYEEAEIFDFPEGYTWEPDAVVLEIPSSKGDILQAVNSLEGLDENVRKTIEALLNL